MIIFVFGYPAKNNLLICNIGGEKGVSRGKGGYFWEIYLAANLLEGARRGIRADS
jgi:hypothetical protein